MRNWVVGDATDFAKYGLLRWLCGKTDTTVRGHDLRLGMVWYLQPDERLNVGKFIKYLERTKKNMQEFAACDAPLWQELRNLVFDNSRCVHYVQISSILPDDTEYYDRLLHYRDSVRGRARQSVRETWLSGAVKTVECTNVVYLDPDTGIRRNDTEKYQQDGPNYAYLDEIHRFWTNGSHSLVIYQSLGHSNADLRVGELAGPLEQKLGVKAIPLSWSLGGTTGLFFVVPHPEHANLLTDRVNRMLAGRWGRYFTLVEVDVSADAGV